MMVAMMLPPEAPFLLRLARIRRERLGRAPLPDTGAFLAGFLAPWIAFSLGAAWLHARLQAAGLVDHGAAVNDRALAAGLLVVAGAVQLSPLKRACLERCRVSPPQAAAGSFGRGVRWSALSIASCGLLMLVPLVTGMSLGWMVLLTLLLFAERVAPLQWKVSGFAGALLAGWGVWTALA
jgi:predicted metal-binding membrane protein